MLIDGSDSDGQRAGAGRGQRAGRPATTRRASRPLGRRAGAGGGAADDPLQPRGPDRQLHHPRAGRGAAADGGHGAVGGRRSCASASKGTLEQLLVTPINPLGLMLGKLAPYLVLSLVEMTLILLAMRFGFGVPIRGNLLLLYVDGDRLPVRPAVDGPAHLHARADPDGGPADGAAPVPAGDLPVGLHLPLRGDAVRAAGDRAAFSGRRT